VVEEEAKKAENPVMNKKVITSVGCSYAFALVHSRQNHGRAVCCAERARMDLTEKEKPALTLAKGSKTHRGQAR